MRYRPFEMERWQSTWEHRVRFNLSESGVHPMTVAELLDLASAPAPLEDVRLGYGQSNGSDLLRERIAALHPGATEANVLVTSGGAEANLVSVWRLLERDEPVAVLLPTYMQIPGLLESLGAPVLPVRLREEEGWQPDLDELDDALHRGARAIVVTNPNNPTGAVLTAEAAEGIVERAASADAWILADEVYRGAEVAEDPAADPPETRSFLGMYERVLSTGSLSKAYGLPGLRLGWVVGPEEEISGLWGRTDYTTIAPATLSDALAVRALDPAVRPLVLARTRRIVRENLAILTDWADSLGGLVTFRPPDAGAIAWLRYDAPVGSTELAGRLRVEHEVLIVPGDHFGIDGHLRIGFGIPAGELEEALERVGGALAERKG